MAKKTITATTASRLKKDAQAASSVRIYEIDARSGHTDGKEHHHHHSPAEYKQLDRRISIIAGHVNSIKKMIEDERDCSEILIQISAVQASLNSLGKLILKNHISQCLNTAIDSSDPEEHQREIDYLNDAIDKFIR